MRFLRTNTAVIIAVGPFFDRTDGVTIETTLTITNERITLTADTDAGSAPTNILDNVTGATSGTDNDLNYITGNDAGMMQLELSAANTNRLGRMLLSITDAANHVPVFHEFMVMPALVYDTFFASSGGATFPAATLASTTNITAGTIAVATTVTNQLTAAAIATGVWQDTTAGDFTTALSVGKSVMNGVALGTGLTVARCTLTDTLTTYTGNTVQTGDVFPLVSTEIADIKAKTDNLPSDPADASDIAASFATVNTKLDTIDDFLDTEIAAIKAKTDLLNVLRGNTAQAGAAGTITLDASASAVDDFYNNTLIELTSGTGVAQSRIISDYVGATKVATVNGNWITTPDATSVFQILAFGAIPGASAPTAAEVADAVWDEDATAHQTLGSFGQAIGDPVADTNTIYKAVVTDATGATVGVDVVAVKAETVLILEDTGTTLQAEVDGIQADTEDIQSRLPAALIGGRIDANVGAISSDATAADNLENAFDDTAGANRWTGIIDQGTAQSATASTLVLRAAADFESNELTGCWLVITGGTGVGQVREITNYSAGTDTASVPTWTTTPSGTITYQVVPAASIKAVTGNVGGNVSGNVIGAVGSVAAGGILSTSFSTAAITADAIAADASAEIADAVWDEDATGHQTLGTFGQAIGDPVADTNTIFKAVVTDAAGATVGVDVVAVKAETAAILEDTSTTLQAEVDGIQADTEDIQTRIPAALSAGGNIKADVLSLGGVVQSLTDLKDFADDGYDPATNKVQGVVLTDTLTTYTGNTVQTGDSFARIGLAGAGLTNIDLPNQTMDIVGNITGNLSGSVGSVTGAVGSVTGAVGSVTGAVGSVTGNVGGNVSGNVIGAVGNVAAGGILSTSFSTGAITVDAIAANAIVASALAPDVATEIRSLVSGTADSGTTTTMVDAARTEADTDFWKGQCLVFTDGSIRGQARLITAFDPVTDTITFAPATTQTVATQTYEIWPSALESLTVSIEAIDNFLDTEVTAIKAKTDLINILRGNTAQSGLAGSITLDAGASALDDFYNNTLLEITSGLGVGQSRVILDYVGATKLATVNGNWVTIPDSTSVFQILAFGSAATAPTAGDIADAVWDEDATLHQTIGTFGQAIGDPVADANSIYKAVVTDATGATVGVDVVSANTKLDTIDDFLDTEIAAIKAKTDLINVLRGGTAQSGAGTTITLDAGASALDDFYLDTLIEITSGTGVGQARVITDYAGATKVATVRGWVTTPDATSVFQILAFGGILTASSVASAVWDEDATGRQIQGSFGQAIGDPGADTNTIYKAVVTDATGATVGVDVAARLPATLVGGRMDASVGAMATDVLTSAALHADAVTEIQGGLATSAALATVDTIVDSILLDTAAIEVTLGSPAGGTVAAALAGIQTGVNDLPTNAELSTALAAADDAILAAIAALNNVTAAAVRDAVFAQAVESGVTFLEAQRLQLASAAGKLSGAAGLTVTIRNAVADSKDRIVATVDANGNRSAITYDLT